MTKQEALKQFKEIFPDWKVIKKADPVAVREWWKNYTDALCKNDVISNDQYETWSNPF